MASGKKKNLIDGILEAAEGKAGQETEAFVPLSIRPGGKIASLLEILSNLTSKSPAEYASDGISESLFLYIASSESALEIAATRIETILESGAQIQKGSALDLLIEHGVIEIDK